MLRSSSGPGSGSPPPAVERRDERARSAPGWTGCVRLLRRDRLPLSSVNTSRRPTDVSARSGTRFPSELAKRSGGARAGRSWHRDVESATASHSRAAISSIASDTADRLEDVSSRDRRRPGDDAGVVASVVHDQEALAAHGSTAAAGGGYRRRRGRRCMWKCCRARLGLALEPRSSRPSARRAACEIAEPEPGAAVAARGGAVHLREGLEQPVGAARGGMPMPVSRTELKRDDPSPAGSAGRVDARPRPPR